MELEVTWARVVRVWWAFFWRNIIAIIGAMILGGIIGGIIGFVMGMAGATKEAIQMVAAPIGGILGLVISLIPIKLVLDKKDFGDFRLVLLKRE